MKITTLLTAKIILKDILMRNNHLNNDAHKVIIPGDPGGYEGIPMGWIEKAVKDLEDSIFVSKEMEIVRMHNNIVKHTENSVRSKER